MRNLYTKNELLKMVRFKIKRHEMEELKNQLKEEELYNLSIFNDINQFKESFMNIKDLYREEGNLYLVNRYCSYLYNNKTFTKPGYINREEVDGDISFDYIPATISNSNISIAMLSVERVRENTKVNETKCVNIYVPARRYD